MCGALAIRLPVASNSAHEKSSRSLMLTEYAVFCSRSPICSAIDMNRLLKTSSMTGSTVVPIARRAARGATRSQHQMVERRDLGPPAGLDHRRRVGLGDDRRAVDAIAGLRVVARDRAASHATHRRNTPALWSTAFSAAGIAPAAVRDPSEARRRRRRSLRPRPSRRSGGDRASGTKSAAGRPHRTRPHRRRSFRADRQRRIGAVVLQCTRRTSSIRSRATPWDCSDCHGLRRQRIARLASSCASRLRRQRPLDRHFAHRRLVGQAHAVGRQHAGERMREDRGHRQRIGDGAGVLAARAAEHGQRVAASHRGRAAPRCA